MMAFLVGWGVFWLLFWLGAALLGMLLEDRDAMGAGFLMTGVASIFLIAVGVGSWYAKAAC